MGVLSVDSKLMQSLRELFDYMTVNMMFVLFSIPIFTIGSAHCAMYTALRSIRIGQPWLRTFVKTFKSSIKRPTILWIICLPVMYIFAGVALTLYHSGLEGSIPPVVCACIILGLLMCITSVAPLLYSRFELTVKQLFRNSLLILLAYPVQVILGSAVIWAPVVIAALVPWLFIELSFWLFLIYFSVASAFMVWLLKYPIGRLADEIPEKPDPYLIREAKKRAGKE